MSHSRKTVFTSDDARVEIFRSEDGGRIDAIVVYAVPTIGVLRMPMLDEREEDTGETLPAGLT